MSLNRNFGSLFALLMSVTVLIATSACHRPITGYEKLGNSILAAVKSNDVSALINLTVGPQDLDQVSRELRRFGWKPTGNFEEEKQRWLSATTEDVSVFLASYKDLFEKGYGNRLLAVVTCPIDLTGATVKTRSGAQMASAIYGHLDQHKVILWTVNWPRNKGIYLPEVYKIGSEYKVNSWLTASPGGIDGELVTERAVLEQLIVPIYPSFPKHIRLIRTYRQ